jgi:hypothetical protein
LASEKSWLEFRSVNPGIGAGPAGIELPGRFVGGFALGSKRGFQSEKRPAIVRMPLQVFTIALFGIRLLFGF